MANIRQFSFLCLTFLSIQCLAQSFDQKISQSTLNLPDQSLAGYESTFDFKGDKVQKGWWKYAKRFALPRNQRTHYEVTIPANNDSRSVVIFSQLDDTEAKPCLFRLALQMDGMTEEEKVKYSDQAKVMLIDFKRWYYLRHYEEQLEKLERAISKKGKNWDEWIKFIRERDAILAQMKAI